MATRAPTQTMEVTWCATELGGPYNGVGVYEGEKVWFFRTETGEIEVHRVSEQVLRMVEEDHAKYCEMSGAPEVHGGPRRIKAVTIKRREGAEGLAEDEELEMSTQAITAPQRFEHCYNALALRGERVAVLQKKDVVNYYVDQSFVYV